MFVLKNIRHVADNNLTKTVYFSLCQSIITYCITSWGGACKSFMTQIERAQRAILKVSHFLPFRYPTKSLYKKCEVLTVRQLFILNTTLKQHSLLSYNSLPLSKRRCEPVSRTSQTLSTNFANRFFCFLGRYLYNYINKHLIIYSLTKKSCKTKVTLWLSSLDYDKTESLLIVPA